MARLGIFVIRSFFVLALSLLPLGCEPGHNGAVSAEAANMRELNTWFTMYKNSHNQMLPQETGQKFLLELWRAEIMEHTDKNARRFFSAYEPYVEYARISGLDPAQISIQAYLSDWERIGTMYTNYAVFDPQDDAELWNQLKTAPESVTILANSTFAHEDLIHYMTADGEVHSLNYRDLLDDGTISADDFQAGMVPVGAGSPIEALRTVSNN
ncbi:MAG: hypothetical protein HQ519_05570 [Planctomycetes bacterium]|nr:hypothetical protein [Planctomycetota bacterium]